MRRLQRIEWIAYGFIAIGFAAVGCVLIDHAVDSIRSLDKEKIGDAATWTGALFAGLAFAGTIWIANTNSRDAREREIRQAKITALRVMPSLQRLFSDLRTAQAKLVFFDPQKDFASSLARAGRTFIERPKIDISREDLLVLNVLEGDSSFRLARAFGLLVQLDSIVMNDLEIAIANKTDISLPTAKYWAKKVSGIADLIAVIANDFSQAIGDHGAEPSGAELYGDVCEE